MTTDTLVGGPTGQCKGCLAHYPPDLLQLFPLVSRSTELFYPGEPFCSVECYNQYADAPTAPFTRPTAAQLERFVRAVNS